LWFLHSGGIFYLASDANRPHPARIRRNPRVGLVIDTEAPERADGQRPDQQVRIIGDATLSEDGGTRTTQSWAKYGRASLNPATVSQRLQGRQRIVIAIQPHTLIAVASV
jgi:hypothetical protein